MRDAIIALLSPVVLFVYIIRESVTLSYSTPSILRDSIPAPRSSRSHSYHAAAAPSPSRASPPRHPRSRRRPQSIFPCPSYPFSSSSSSPLRWCQSIGTHQDASSSGPLNPTQRQSTQSRPRLANRRIGAAPSAARCYLGSRNRWHADTRSVGRVP